MHTTTVQPGREAAADLRNAVTGSIIARSKGRAIFVAFLERIRLNWLESKSDHHAIKAKSRRRDDAKPTGLKSQTAGLPNVKKSISSPLPREERSKVVVRSVSCESRYGQRPHGFLLRSSDGAARAYAWWRPPPSVQEPCESVHAGARFMGRSPSRCLPLYFPAVIYDLSSLPRQMPRQLEQDRCQRIRERSKSFIRMN